jgi:D-3-phosphoglycerate dehydrogenase
MSHRVLVAYAASHPVEVGTFESTAPEFDVDVLELPAGGHGIDADDELVAALDGHDALFVRTVGVSERVVESAPSLRAVVTHGSGYDHIDVDAATRNGVVVAHTPEGPGPGVVEHTFAVAFTLLRDLPRRYDRMADGEWFAARDTVPELGTRTVGVVGLGTIGFEVARVAAGGFGADVVAYDPHVTGELDSRIYPRVDRETVEAEGVELVGWERLFERADVVTLHTPLTDRTREFVGAAEFDALDGGYVINVARGGVLDEEALLDALDDGRVAGAGLDVFGTEPTENTRLLEHPNVQATPHIAGVTDGYLDRTARLGAERVRVCLEGDRPEALLNPAVFDG